jgi:homocysteine S-methyltransferase
MTSSEFTELLAKKILIFDGAYGTELYRKNFFVNTNYDNLNITNPDVISSICQAYVEAGVDVLTTNTYSANTLHLGRFGLAESTEKINIAAVALAKKAAAGKPPS